MALARIASELLDYLRVKPVIVAQVSGRVYAGLMPEGLRYDQTALVFSSVSAPAPRDLQRKIGLIESRWQFDCYGGDRYTSAESLSVALDTALVDDFTGLASIVVQQCVRDGGPSDLSEEDGDRRIRRLQMDYFIYYQEN